MKSHSRIKSLFFHALLLILGVSYVLPFAWLLTSSLQPDEVRFKLPPAVVPAPKSIQTAIHRLTGQDLCYQPTFEHYHKATTRVPILLFFRNTLLVCTLTVIGTIISSSIVAYGFSILRWRGRDTVFFAMLATIMLPVHVRVIPMFIVWRNLGMVNTFAPLVVPAFLGTPFFIFLFRQFFLTIPRDLIDSARVDGASELWIWGKVVMPLSIPVIATTALFSFLAAWNDFLGPLIYIADQGKYTLSLGLAMFRSQFGTEYGQMMAVATLMVIPIIVLFFVAQKTFVQGIKTTGLKE